MNARYYPDCQVHAWWGQASPDSRGHMAQIGDHGLTTAGWSVRVCEAAIGLTWLPPGPSHAARVLAHGDAAVALQQAEQQRCGRSAAALGEMKVFIHVDSARADFMLLTGHIT